jgi:hypothetical protein
MDTTQLYKVGNFDQNTINQLALDTGSLVESISAAGALTALGIFITELSVDGTKAYTLAAPTFAGQRKLIRCVAATNTPLGTVTISAPDTTTGFVCSSTFTFTAVGQAIELRATTGLKWRCERVFRSGAQLATVNVTVLTGLNLAANYNLSVTGTVTSAGTKGIPDGSAVGEVIQVGCSTAASIPSGTIAITGRLPTGAAATTLGTYNATTVWASLMWDGSAWEQLGGVTAVLS